MAGGWRLLAADFAMSFMWVWSSVLNKILVHRILGYGAHELDGQIIRYTVSILNMFFFAFLAKATKGAYNPLSLLSAAFSGDFSNFLFTLGARLPTQGSGALPTRLPLAWLAMIWIVIGSVFQNNPVVGAIYGVRLILDTFPDIGRGPRLNVDIAKGALTEGLLTFSISFISLGLARKVKDSFFMKTWIASLSKLTLHILGSDLTGGCMNPASVMGWAFANGEHITKEHLVVYWLAPVQGTFAAVWVFGILTRAKKDKTVAAKDRATKLKSGN